MMIDMVARLGKPHLFSRRGWLVGAVALIVGAGGCRMPTPSPSLMTAVYDGDRRRVRELIASGANLEERESDGSTPLLLAVESNQFEIAEALIDAGANIWVTSDFGNSVGWAAEKSRLISGPDADARQRVLVQLRDRGFPFPAQHSSIVLKKVQAGEWPPRSSPKGL
jgi:Ankyrin repeats (3 copies)